MPIYEYRCTQCRHVFETYQSVGEPAPNCPQCGSPSRKVYASVGLIFKGSGFHTTDYRKSTWGDGDTPAPPTTDKPVPSTTGKPVPSTTDKSAPSTTDKPAPATTDTPAPVASSTPGGPAKS